MTPYDEVLQLYAQLFVALAGFAGIIAAFNTFSVAPEATAFRVRFLVAVALFSLIASVLPMYPPLYGAPEIASLRISSFVAAAGLCGIAVANWRAVRGLFKSGVLHTQSLAIVLYVGAAVQAIGLVAVAAGLLPHFGWAIYLTFLLFSIVVCSYYFVMMMLAADIGKLR